MIGNMSTRFPAQAKTVTVPFASGEDFAHLLHEAGRVAARKTPAPERGMRFKSDAYTEAFTDRCLGKQAEQFERLLLYFLPVKVQGRIQHWGVDMLAIRLEQIEVDLLADEIRYTGSLRITYMVGDVHPKR